MAGEHGGCCCNHDDQHDNHDHHDVAVHAPQIQLATEASGCCGGTTGQKPADADADAGLAATAKSGPS